MRKFSDELEAERDFEIGGELMRWRYPHWETGAAIFDNTLVPANNGKGEQPEFTFKSDTEFAINAIPMMLEPESAKKFKLLVARKDNPVPRHQIAALYRWLVEVTAGLPTTRPEDSGPEAQESATSSPAPSPSTGAPSKP